MAKKETATHDVYTLNGNQAEKSEAKGASDKVQVIIPKGTPYVKVRKALEIALLRVR